MCQCACAVSECLCFALTSYSFSFFLFLQRSNPKATRANPFGDVTVDHVLGPAHPLTSPFLCPRVFLASISQTPFLHMLRFLVPPFLGFYPSEPTTHPPGPLSLSFGLFYFACKTHFFSYSIISFVSVF